MICRGCVLVLKQSVFSPDLLRLNNDIKRATWNHKQFVETLDDKSDTCKLWRTIKAIDSKVKPSLDNEAINFKDTFYFLTVAASQQIQQTVYHI